MNIKDFNRDHWYFERGSGYEGYRNIHTDEWIYSQEYHHIIKQQSKYDDDMELLSRFRSECLPGGEYSDSVLVKFLDKKYGLG